MICSIASSTWHQPCSISLIFFYTTVVICGEPPPEKGMTYQFNYPQPGESIELGTQLDTYLKTVTRSCKNGYNSNGESGTSTCTAEGNWSPILLRCYSKCILIFAVHACHFSSSELSIRYSTFTRMKERWNICHLHILVYYLDADDIPSPPLLRVYVLVGSIWPVIVYNNDSKHIQNQGVFHAVHSVAPDSQPMRLIIDLLFQFRMRMVVRTSMDNNPAGCTTSGLRSRADPSACSVTWIPTAGTGR